MRCGWCETHNPAERSHCVSCGGPLRSLTGALESPPPPAPRVIPAMFVRRAVREDAWFGGMFAAIGGGISLLFLCIAPFVPFMLLGLPISLLFGAVGAGIALAGWRRAQRRVAVLRDGAVVPGAVASVIREGDGWRLTWRSEAGEGSVLSTDAEITRFGPGFRVHVVRMGAESDVWPPFG